jgi:hypothetical protein
MVMAWGGGGTVVVTVVMAVLLVVAIVIAMVMVMVMVILMVMVCDLGRADGLTELACNAALLTLRLKTYR